ncbi:hypothetical protein EBS02_09180, partial [bacterium]|nr:hypothetical protein [bacterium]
ERKKIYDEVQQLMKKIQHLEKQIEDLKKLHLPVCSSCHQYKFPSSVWKASEEDIRDYIDQNEGYSGPIWNEWYCGC